MNRDLQMQIDKGLTELAEVLSSVETGRINTIPFEGSWTAGQLAQHMIMSNGGFVDLINGPVTDTDRDPANHVDDLRFFLNFNIKFESPEFIRPPQRDYNKDELLRSLEEIKEKMQQALEKPDLSKTCISFEIPTIGHLTQLEAAYFVLFHTQRHIHQLRNISSKLVSRDLSLT